MLGKFTDSAIPPRVSNLFCTFLAYQALSIYEHRPARCFFCCATLKEFTMGRFDSRNSLKMRRRKSQEKLKERLARRAEATKAERKGK